MELGPERFDLGPERVDFGPERADFRFERAALGLRGLIWGLRGAWGGDVRTDVRTDIWKFTPVSYRTSALWGRCPKSVLPLSPAPLPFQAKLFKVV